MKILSIQVGKPKTVTYRGQEVTTGIFKEPVSGPVLLRMLNLEGDGQADLRVHGGRDKALYGYSADAYPLWQEMRPQNSFPAGAMGENLTFELLDEAQIHVGDIFELGEARVQATQPRMPCHKLAVKFEDPAILKQFMKMARPGIYFRVLREGLIKVGDELQLQESGPAQVSILELFNFSVNKTATTERVNDILRIEILPAYWRKELESWLKSQS